MVDYFETAGFPLVMRGHNDGQPFHETPGDPGGATAWGVTYTVWVAWRRSHGWSYDLETFKTQTAQDMKPIYRAYYWNANRCCNMGALGIVVFDASVMSGVGRAARFLQEVLNVVVDGEIGPKTIGALNQYYSMSALNVAFYNKRIEFYQSLTDEAQFLTGWTRRCAEGRDMVQSIFTSPV